MNNLLTDDYYKRKEEFLLKDLETAFSGYERLVRQVNSIRTWTVTIMVACIGFLITKYQTIPIYVVAVPAMITLLAFLILELRERSSMKFNKAEVIDIENLLMITDNEEFKKAIHEYIFRDLRLNKLDRGKKLGHLIDSLLNFQITYWYFFWILVFWTLVVILNFV